MAAPVLITREKLASEAAAAWKLQYPDGRYGSDKAKIWQRLVALGASPTPEQVNEVIGNSSWTRIPDCGGCNDNEDDCVVQVGQEPDYESHTAYLCPKCLRAAVALLGGDS